MELVSGFLLWLADIFGVKWVQQERMPFKKILKALAFLIVGIILVILFFVLWY